MTEHLPFQVMGKPTGPRCNLDCTYCYYLEKEELYPDVKRFTMPDAVLEAYIRDYLASQAGFPSREIRFNWQGGEPTMLGLDYFRRIVDLQRKHLPRGKTIANTIQTNGTLLDDEWCAFLKDNDFLVGVSIDGPRELHDRFRTYRNGRPSHAAVMAGIERMKAHGVEFNTLTVVNRENAAYPEEIYQFLKDIGSTYLQFIPIVERTADGHSLAPAPQIDEDGVTYDVTAWSVLPRAYGDFLCGIFDAWISRDVGRVFVQFFDLQLGLWMGAPATMCWFAETCGQGPALEHNGDLYACDHYVYPEYRLGNVMEIPIAEMMASDAQRQFGLDKREALPAQCRSCDLRFACNGGCPKHRFLKTKDGEPGLNYYCRSMARFNRHAGPAMKVMAHLVRSGRPASDIMQLRRSGRLPGASAVAGRPGRNDRCPCGSGLKYKQCCGRP
ncbi:anaerobic sulfatase maturase [Martelella lutilitoris]|uniref:Anaerobic sulfatase maturase n=1 Tax=Martelella lutilitoris TaxID=2583532 RepID=A0A7T7KM68_9HYPH|nr:anaerobic sulfatase maturase [Martelella lutilitoris]QQM31502.1 anaerobic sulfatase maturase [Martelella lutilitoris]